MHRNKGGRAAARTTGDVCYTSGLVEAAMPCGQTRTPSTLGTDVSWQRCPQIAVRLPCHGFSGFFAVSAFQRHYLPIQSLGQDVSAWRTQVTCCSLAAKESGKASMWYFSFSSEGRALPIHPKSSDWKVSKHRKTRCQVATPRPLPPQKICSPPLWWSTIDLSPFSYIYTCKRENSSGTM